MVPTKFVPDRKKKTPQARSAGARPGGSRTILRRAAFLRWSGSGLCASGRRPCRRVRSGRVHTNGLEKFWSLFQRGIKGTYVSVEPFHLFHYLDEQEFWFNNRGNRQESITDGERLDLPVRNIVGKRLTYKELTGKPTSCRRCRCIGDFLDVSRS